ncbi:hypothetical protein MKW98_019722 [Papaver atlanticum]|uniref:LOB domain-containing protein n=1 Tax=Papaver atlanticum TaxID=357466 RepID=A0AAD4TCG1_9MAGN|nr:hypothetical protein MKW98_019722 [Papaver atlanticum]
MMGKHGSSCGACKFLRRKCNNGCVFAPYFCFDESATHFAAVHKVFGAANVSKHLSQLPVQDRSEAALTISYEALARMRDPTYGCVSQIFALQQQVAILQKEIQNLETQVAASRATNALINHQTAHGLQDINSSPFHFSSSQLHDKNLHNSDPSNLMSNINGNVVTLQMNQLFGVQYTNVPNSYQNGQLEIGKEQEIFFNDPCWFDVPTISSQSSSNGQVINCSSFLDDILLN